MIHSGFQTESASKRNYLQSLVGHEGPVGSISLEEGIADHVFDELRRLGHDIEGPVRGFHRTIFGRGHIIKVIDPVSSVEGDRGDCGDGANRLYLIGCEPRSDGKPCGY